MPKHSGSHQVRIIGGKWKGRKLQVAANVRPTPDRVRETLFNWLSAELPGARVLDLFAGTGALGFEALSRGAAHATFVERDRNAARLLADSRDRLDACATVAHAAASNWLRRNAKDQWDVVFLDPPYDAKLLAPALRTTAGRLTDTGVIYVESDAGFELAASRPASLATKRAASAGAVYYALLGRSDRDDGGT